jgi:hypothetical protein
MSIVAEVAALRTMTVRELRDRYVQVFGEESRSRNKDYLWKRIAYGIQEQAEGVGLSERAKARAAELARDSDIRVRNCLSPQRRAALAGTTPPPPIPATRDPRLPPVGTVLRRDAHGRAHEVLVAEQGFVYEGETYRSISAVATKIAGAHCNGFAYFGLTKFSGALQ